MATTSIEWADAVWNPIVGCQRVSAGCQNCYAEGFAKRLAGMAKTADKYRGLVDDNGRWTGVLRLDEAALDAPLRWKKPRRIFVNSMGDLMHPNVRESWIDQVLEVIGACPQHVFMVLTKRPENFEQKLYGDAEDVAVRVLGGGDYLPNLWLGVTAENQETADARITLLMRTLAAVRFVSCEPLLGPIDLTELGGTRYTSPDGVCRPLLRYDALRGYEQCGSAIGRKYGKLDLVIAGGETGPNARPMHPDWVRGLRDQCQAAGVPFFFKQWGEFIQADSPQPVFNKATCDFETIPAEQAFVRVGKKRAGAVLDGREWRELPGGLG